MTAKHETTVSWHKTKINMMKSRIEGSRVSTRSDCIQTKATSVAATIGAAATQELTQERLMAVTTGLTGAKGGEPTPV